MLTYSLPTFLCRLQYHGLSSPTFVRSLALFIHDHWLSDTHAHTHTHLQCSLPVHFPISFEEAATSWTLKHTADLQRKYV
jgi:hypothetical protein